MATLAEGRKAVACSHPLDPKSTQAVACSHPLDPKSTVAGVWPQDAGQRWVGLHVHAARGLGGFVCRMQAVEGCRLARAGSDA